MNLGLENLVVNEPVTREPIDLREVEESLNQIVEGWVKEMDRENKLDMVKTIAKHLGEAKEDDNSLMSFVKEDLMALGISCESNTTAATELTTFLEKNIDVSQEIMIAEALLIASMVALLISYFVALIAMFDDLGDWIQETVTENEAIIDKGLRTEPKDENKEIYILTNAKYMKLMTAHASAIKVFADNAKDFGTTDMDKIHQIMKGASIVWDGNTYTAVDQYMLISQTVDKAGWNPATLKTAEAQLLGMAKELVVFKKLRKTAEDAAKKAKSYEKTPEMTSDEKSEKKEAAKAKAADMKKANAEMKKYATMAKEHIMACGWTMQRALRQFAK